ncbi:hypothetical protein LPJ61_002891 [Coemansia biformis]|uniref:Alpha/beta hydrolase fold-3 domain-containing protein n=1 Tax=Coemansia biformis TaxID=1286918 RepID=A0A9W7Y7J2_9FUNG|nr:hypothetical protein LPJ61_002891 [Coemansia biformis]
MASLSCAGGVPLALPLKTKDTLLGRLQNMRFLAVSVATTILNYYWNGPEVESWSLRFHIFRDILRLYLAESLPHSMPNDASESIDFALIADYIAINNFTAHPLHPSEGCSREHAIVLDTASCVRYGTPHYGLSGAKLDAMAASDLQAAQRGDPRSISCQVVLSARTATRLGVSVQDTTHSMGVYGERLLAPNPIEPDERVILHLHGGAYCVGERSLSHIQVFARMSHAAGLRVFSPDYRLAPRHCFPSQLHDCFATYMSMLRRGFQPANMILSGDSAGGALALGLLFLLRDMRLPQPAAVVLISPWVDATCSGKSWAASPTRDYLPALSLEDPFHPTRMFYAPGRRLSDEMLEELRCPLVSPIFGDCTGLPPMLVQMGRDELLRDDIDAFAARLGQQGHAGASFCLEKYDNMPHAFVLFDFAKEAQQAFDSIGVFARTHTSGPRC